MCVCVYVCVCVCMCVYVYRILLREPFVMCVQRRSALINERSLARSTLCVLLCVCVCVTDFLDVVVHALGSEAKRPV